MCFCYWPNFFMKGDKRGYFSKFPDWKHLFLFKMKIKQNPGCPNKEFKVDFKHFHQNIRVYHKSKKICISQWLVKCFILGRSWAKRGVADQIWFVPDGGFWGKSLHQVNFADFEINHGNSIFLAFTLARNCYLNMNISFSWTLAI